MAQRSVQFDLDFDVKNINTIGELEDELTSINQQLKNVDVNSASFKELQKQAQAADGKLRTIQTSLEGVTAQEKSDSLKKLGEAGVGAFQAMAGASLLFGDKVGEEIEKATQKATALFNVFDGLDKVTRVFSAETVKGLGAVVKGFQKSSIAAKLFGNTTKAALTSTGIGAIIVLIGLIIANFDKLKAAVQKNMDKIKKAIMVISPPLYLIIRLFDRIKKQVGDLQNLLAGIGAFIKSIFKFDGSGLKGATEEFKKQVELQKELDRLRDEFNNKIKDTVVEYERELELMKERGDSQELINEKVRSRLELEEDLLKQFVLSGKATDEQIERLEEIEFQLKLQTIREANLAAQRKKEAKELAEKQRERIEAEKKITEEKKKQAELEEKQRIETNKRISELQDENERLLNNYNFEKRRLEQLRDFDEERIRLIDTFNLKKINTIDLTKDAIKETGVYLDVEKAVFEIENDRNITAREKERLIANLQKAEIEYYSRIGDGVKNVNDFLTDEEKLKLNLLQLDKQKLSFILFELENQRQLNSDKLKSAETSEEEQELLKTDRQLYTDILLVKNEIYGIDKQQNEVIKESAKVTAGNLDIQDTALQKLKKGFEEYRDEILAAQELISNTFDLIANVQDARAQKEDELFTQQIDAQIEALDEFYAWQEERLTELNDLKKDYADEEKDLNDLLRDAEGDRYNDILDQINAVKRAEEIRAQEEKDLKNQAIAAEYALAQAEYEREKAAAQNAEKIAKTEKAQALISAAIQTTLATIEALPNVVLSAIVGTAGAVGIGAIAAQRIPPAYLPPAPPAPKYLADGGLLNGASHADGGIPAIMEGGEYVVNKLSTSAFLPLLEAVNARKFADGGRVTKTSVNSPDKATELIDYNRLAQAIAAQPIWANWSEGAEMGRRVKFVESRSSV